jgi:hypothetical protein
LIGWAGMNGAIDWCWNRVKMRFACDVKKEEGAKSYIEIYVKGKKPTRTYTEIRSSEQSISI